MNINDKIKTIGDTDLVISMTGKYTNSLVLNGFILQPPLFDTNYRKGGEVCTITLHQINRVFGSYLDKTYSLVCFIPSIVEKLKEIKTCCFINCVCTLEWSKKLKKNYGQLYNFEISCVLDDPFAEKEDKQL